MENVKSALVKGRIARLWTGGGLFLLLAVIFFLTLPADPRRSEPPSIESESIDPLSARMRDRLQSETSSPEIARLYRERNYALIWIQNRRLGAEGRSFVQRLRAAEEEGLRPADYLNTSLDENLAGLESGARYSDSVLIDVELSLTQQFFVYGRHQLEGKVRPERLHPLWSLPPREMDLPAFLARESPSKVLAASSPPHAGYARLRRQLLLYRGISEIGGWGIVPAGRSDADLLAPGMADDRVPYLRRRLRFTDGPMPLLSDTSLVFDESLAQALRGFQHRHGLPETAILDEPTRLALNVPVETRIDQILVNLERWRWMPAHWPERRIEINLPAFSLDVFDAGKRLMTMKIVVGKAATPTPVLQAEINRVVLAPYWYVPRSIATQEILPLQRNDASYLSRHRMQVFSQGKSVDPDSIAWGELTPEAFPYAIRQEPGPANSLGRLRFQMPNPEDIGLHDTPERYLFSRSSRAFSHGCIRIEKPIELALFVLDDPDLTSENLLRRISTWVEQSLAVERPVPVQIFYWTAWADGTGRVHFRDDIYRHDQQLRRLLASDTPIAAAAGSQPPNGPDPEPANQEGAGCRIE